jgi:hypothetical protein
MKPIAKVTATNPARALRQSCTVTTTINSRKAVAKIILIQSGSGANFVMPFHRAAVDRCRLMFCLTIRTFVSSLLPLNRAREGSLWFEHELLPGYC